MTEKPVVAETVKPAEAETVKPAEAETAPEAVKTEASVVETVVVEKASGETEPPKQEEAVVANDTKTKEEPLVTL